MWIPIEEKNLPLPEEELLLFNKNWIDEDFNPNGTRIGFSNDNGENWIIAKWCNYHDEYHTLSSEIYNTEQFFLKKEDFPTHYIRTPKNPLQ